MLRMIKLGAAVLPLHDSFIVRNSYEGELRAVMEEEFQAMFGQEGHLTAKPTMLENRKKKDSDEEFDFTTDDIKEILEEMKKKEWAREMFGINWI